MGTVAIRCSKCGIMKFYKNNKFCKDFYLDRKHPICIKCYKKDNKK